MSGSLRSLFLGVVCTSATAFLSVAALAGLGAGVRVLESDESGMTLEIRIDSLLVTPLIREGSTFHSVEVPGFLMTEEEGLPQLPYTAALVAIPFGKKARLGSIVNETAVRSGIIPVPVSRASVAGGEFPMPVREFAMDQDFYTGNSPYPADVATVGTPATLRHQRVVSIFLFPIKYAPASRELVYSRRLSVRVDFVDAQRREPLNREPAPSFELYSEGLYEGLLLNYEQAKHWRMKPRSRAAENNLPLAQAQHEYKIPIDSTGLYRVACTDLLEGDRSHPVEQVRLFEKFYEESDPSPFEQTDVPVHVVDADSNGYFDGTDYFVFYGLSFRDRFRTDTMEARYSYDNVYWLTVEGSPGLHMSERSSWPHALNPQQAQSFFHTERLEVDRLYMNVPPRVDMDYYFWKDHAEYDVSESFYVYAPDTTRAWSVRAHYQGLIEALHYVTVIIENSRGQVDTLFNRAAFGPSTPSAKVGVTLDTGLSISASLLASGTNTFRYIGEKLLNGSIYPGSGAYFDWFEIAYFKRYVALNGELTCSSGELSGEVEFRIGGFPSENLLLYDITDPLNVERLTIEEWQTTPESDGHYLVFRDLVGVSPKRYAVADLSVLRPAPQVVLDNPSSLVTSGASKDYFVIAHDDFVPLLAPLVSQREDHGHRVELASLSDVFDEFNGGRRSCRAIKRYMKHAFNSWGTPLFLLLVGDASEDYKGCAEGSDPDFLSSYLILSPVEGPLGKELVGSDQWYVTALDGIEDDYPDMYVGRLPVGSIDELSSLVDKIVAYEAFSPGQSFRGRGLFIADDAYSSARGNYCIVTDESVFEGISLSMRQLIEESQAVPDFVADTLFLSTYLDTFPSWPKPTCVSVSQMQEYTRSNVTPRLLALMSEGGLFVNYQGHGNRTRLTEENLFIADQFVRDDVFVSNENKPAFFIAFACHVGDFDSQSEKEAGDCLVEKLLVAPDRGAIASFATTAFEHLPTGTHGDMNHTLFDALFVSPPTEDLRGNRGMRWLLGEVVTSAKTRFLAGHYLNKHIVRTYSLLGDPGLRMDAFPPRLLVTVNHLPYTDGSYLHLSSPDDSARISAFISDEIAVNANSIWIEELGDEGRGTIPLDEYEVTVLADTIGGASKKFYLYFPTVLHAGTYDIGLHAMDVNSRETLFRLTADLRVEFSSQGEPIADGTVVPANLPLEILVDCATILSQEETSLLVDGVPVVAKKEQVDQIGRVWRLEANVALSDGEHLLALAVDGVERSVTVSVAAGFAMRQVFCYPSPFGNVTSFNYDLTGSPVKVLIELFTVSGRKIREIEGTPRAGYNSVVWEGRDAEGHRVANGLYIYKVTATDGEGRVVSELGKVVKIE
ncbi:MAG: hypothetical protein AMJ46_13300 [Latescibacteria bacterium DG_63]|nr:MAG: hypothetical protein AMJ46_13300 [Latescibacteria bacterium DG_63]